MECEFKVGDKVMLNGNPFDEQLGEYGAYGIHIIKEVREVPNNYWVKTNKHGEDWISQDWFDPVT